MSESLHPTEGIRVLLTFTAAVDDSRASYLAAVYTVDACFEYDATLCEDGAVDLAPRLSGASEPDEKQLKNICASVARSSKRKRDEGLPPWPARINRWRGPGRGSTR